MNDLRNPDFARITDLEKANIFIEKAIFEIKEEVGNEKVLLALSGGVDSSVTCALIYKAIKDNLVCVHVNHGLLRKGESEEVIKVFKNEMHANLIYVDASEEFLSKLEGITDPEEKRKIIGSTFIDIFSREANKLDGIKYLAQGTIYPDILESKGIKAHHNVGGLPEKLKFKLIEPVKYLYKDEIRLVGLALGLKEEMVYRQPFPGPGLAVRCPGAITKERLEKVRESDAILREEFKNHGLDKVVWQYFTIVPDFKSTGIKNNLRTYDYFVVIRAIISRDATSCETYKIPYEVLFKIRDRILNEVDGVNRVLFDISPKPISTIEWE